MMPGFEIKFTYVLNIFSKKDLLLSVEIPQGDGSIKKLPRKPGLRKGAKPTILPNCPSYLQDHSETPERLDRMN